MSVGRYRADNVIALIGAVPVQGFGPGTFINIQPVQDTFETYIGIDGELARIRRLDKLYDVSISILPTSNTNDFLSALYVTDTKTNLGLGVQPLSIVDLNGGSIFFAAFSWINNPPDITYAANASIRTWVFRCVSSLNFIATF